ncbi:MAG TPA: hypothetical protein VHB79_04295 [Polyangiaceae bacterium]|nr:hypothetical protein [Polyangiaceae bacterium]
MGTTTHVLPSQKESNLNERFYLKLFAQDTNRPARRVRGQRLLAASGSIPHAEQQVVLNNATGSQEAAQRGRCRAATTERCVAMTHEQLRDSEPGRTQRDDPPKHRRRRVSVAHQAKAS